MSTDPLERFRVAAAERERAGLHRTLRARPAGGDGLLDLAGNDYLGLTHDPRVTRAAADAALTWGAGATGSRLVTGTTGLHAALEESLADFTGAPAALVFSSGYLANLAAVAALTGPGTTIVSDAANHASLVDACRLSRAAVVVTPHADVAAVERALSTRDTEHAAVVTDSVFSVDGDLAPLTALYEVTRRHGALLIVDEAHALGVIGPAGQGAVHAAGLSGATDIVRTTVLSKSLGSQGGVVLGAPEIRSALIDTGRSFIFDTGLAPAAVGAALAALDVLRDEPWRPARARAHAHALADLVAGAGLVPNVPAAAVVSGLVGDPHAAVAAQARCAEHGVRVGCFRPPSVPPGASCLRLTARADLTAADLSRVEAALASLTPVTAP
ncbi:MAG TPA: 8-amino-7-oxononanoate synthase [Mycobacteriales bacterium]